MSVADSVTPILELENVRVAFGEGRHRLEAVRGVSFGVQRGETFALVGESGSGKTTLGRAIMRIHPLAGGQIRVDGATISGPIPREAEKALRQKVQMVFQDPMASLNERAKVDAIVAEGLDNFRLYANQQERQRKIEQVLADVGLSPEAASRFPHEFSGGQRQRIGMARALILRPQLLIADEPISALDVSIRAQILNLLNRLKAEYKLSLLFVAHDLSVVRFLADRTGVMYRGRLVELAPTQQLFDDARHPYTRSLLSAVPIPDPRRERSRTHLVWEPGNEDEPHAWIEVSSGHFVAL